MRPRKGGATIKTIARRISSTARSATPPAEVSSAVAEMARSLTRVGRGAVAPEAVIAAEEVPEAVRDSVQVLGAVATA